MGNHKKKSKHRKEKKKHNKKRKHHSSSSSSSTSEEEWVEKETSVPSPVANASTSRSNVENSHREEMNFLPMDILTSSHLDRRKEREENKRRQKEKDQYNPHENPRELNPYWKKGGDGLPSTSFIKPSENSNMHYHKRGESNWRVKSDVKDKNDCSASRKPKGDSDDRKSHTSLNSSTAEDLNILGAKLIKAEIMGNENLVNELKKKLELARKSFSEGSAAEQTEDIILTRTDSKGFSMPLKSFSDADTYSKNRFKKQKVETHSNKQRVRYFPDDDKYSLHQMFEAEKFNTAKEQNIEYMKMIGKVSKNDDEDDIFTDKIRVKESDVKSDKKNKEKAINEHRRINSSLDSCNRCLQTGSMSKHLMVSMGENIYLSVPSHEPLTEGHCLLIPIRHTPCATQLDENEWSELLNFRKSLTAMFYSVQKDVIFFESAIYLDHFPHMSVECVPLPNEIGDLAPIYFKKAIDESETEWASNKKLVSLKGRNVRKAIPKGLPYFTVSFGMEEGYAHVIEDEKLFPNNFAQEIIGGMLDLHHSKWRKPKKQSFDEQSKNVLDLSKLWTKFDCTVNK